MKYDAFKKLVQEKGWTVAELRCDVRPSQELLDLMDRVGKQPVTDDGGESRLGTWPRFAAG